MRRLKYELRKTVKISKITFYYNRYILNREFYYQVGLRFRKMRMELVVQTNWIKKR